MRRRRPWRGRTTPCNVRSIWIDNFEATVENEKIKKYRINGKISFMLEG
jgi:hypothetical protein